MIAPGWRLWDSITIAGRDPAPSRPPKTAPVTRIRLLTTLTAALTPGAALALDLAMPAPVLAIKTRTEASASYALPTGPFAAGAVPTRAVEGVMDQRAYRLEGGTRTLTDLAAPLKAQLQAQGYAVVLDCETRVCGGFDFRFAIAVMPEPDMHVNLGEFRFIAAEKGAEAVSLLVSRSAGSGFVQVTRVGPEALPPLDPAAPAGGFAATPPDPAPTEPAPPSLRRPSRAAAPLTPPPGGLIGALEAEGSVALDDLVFASGAAVLEEGDYASLEALAGWLKADPARSVALVGHTDGSGALAANVALSKKRAEGVRQVLLMRFDVAPAQVTAEGVGPLAPRASNDTEAGRQKNRRVEAVKTSTQ